MTLKNKKPGVKGEREKKPILLMRLCPIVADADFGNKRHIVVNNVLH